MRKIKNKTSLALYTLLAMNLFGYIVMTVTKGSFKYQMNLNDYKNFGTYNILNQKVFTSMFIHENYKHLFVNMVILVLVYLTVKKFFNPLSIVTTYFVSGLGSNIVYVFLNQGVTVGASSGVFGLLGLVISLSLKDILLRRGNRKKVIVFGLITLGILIGVFGTNANVIGHLTGLSFGLILGIILIATGKVKI